MTLTNGGWGSTAFPVKVGCEIDPVRVAGVPENVSAGTVLLEPLKVGTPAGHAIVPAGVNAAVPLVPVAVRV